MNNVNPAQQPESQAKTKVCLDDLPVFPEVVLRLQELVQDENSTIPAMAELINTSPTLLAQLLRYVNSPRYSMGVEVESAQIAIGVLGRHTTTSLLTTVALRETFHEFSSRHVTLANFFQYGLAVAATIEAVSEVKKLEMSLESIAIGILHNIGELALLHTMSDDYTREVVDAADRAASCRSTRELNAFGFDHYGFGVKLMRKWGLSESYCLITESIPESAPVTCEESDIVCLRTAIAHTRINHSICPKWWLSEAAEFSPALISGETVSDVLSEATERYEKLSSMLA